MKKLNYIILIIFSLFLTTNVDAENIRKIRMDIDITKDGTAHIQEIWEVFVGKEDKLTEIYRIYSDYGNSKFDNFKVSLNGKEYTYIKNWDINKSFKEKSYKNGFHKKGTTMELCWGISKKGEINEYRISYDITNFVTGAKDGDIVYKELIPKNISNEPEKVYIKIYSSDYVYGNEVEAYESGNKEKIKIKNGYIEISKNKQLSSDENIEVLIKYPKDKFEVKNKKSDKSSDYYMRKANVKDINMSIVFSIMSLTIIVIASCIFKDKIQLFIHKIKNKDKK